jgi:hypothetical protein
VELVLGYQQECNTFQLSSQVLIPLKDKYQRLHRLQQSKYRLFQPVSYYVSTSLEQQPVCIKHPPKN